MLLNQTPRACKSLCRKLMCTLAALKIISSQADRALSEFTFFHKSCMTERRLTFERFNRQKEQLDNIFMKQTDISSYPNFLPILKLMLVLGHGHANVERCFSINNNVLR